MKVKKLLSLCLTLLITLGMISPAAAAIATAAETLSPEEYKIYHSIGPGDVANLSSYGLDTPEAIDEYLDTLEDLGINRIYWRGLELSIITNQLKVRPESISRVLYQALVGGSMYWEENNYTVDGAVLTMDQYLVQEAHKRGMTVIGQAKLFEYGGPGDSAYGLPYAYYGHYDAHPEWSSVDQWGLMKKSAVDFSYPEARKYVVDTIMAEVEKVGYDGVQFFSYSESFDQKYTDQFGYNDPAVEEFQRRYGITPELDNLSYRVSLEQWRMLRGEYLTEFLREMKTALEAYSAESGNGDTIAMCISSSEARRPEIWSPYISSMITDNTYLDFETYVQEGIVDEFHIKGNTAVEKQIKLIDDMLWLCRGTDTEVVIISSVADHSKFGHAENYWEPYLQKGVGLQIYYTAETGTSVGTVTGDHLVYKTGPDISGKVDTLSPESQLRYRVAQVALGNEQASFDQLEEWIRADGTVVPRMAMSALVQFYNEDPRTPALLEEALTFGNISVHGLALRYISAFDYETDTMAQTILDHIDDDNAWGTYNYSAPALQHMVDTHGDLVWNVFASSESSLRQKAIAMEALNGIAMTEEQVAAVHEVITGEAFATEYHDVNGNGAEAVEAIYKTYIRGYCVNLMYHAARQEGTNVNTAKNYLLDYAQSNDTVIATAAVDLLRYCATATYVDDAWKAEAVSILKERFADLSSKSDADYGESDWKDWAYRPVGRSLLAFGDAGTQAMEEFYNSADKELATYAFKCLYLPVSERSVTLMTYEAYKEAYSHLPRALLADYYKTVKVAQDFEDTSIFDATANPPTTGLVGKANNTTGRWYMGGNSSFARITNTNNRSGSQSVMLTGNMAVTQGVTVYNSIAAAGQDYRVSVWIYHQGGTFSISTALSGTNNNQYGDPTGAEAFVQVDDEGKVWFYDYVNDEPAFKDTGLTVPKNKWTQLSFEVIRSGGTNKASVSVRPEGEWSSNSDLFSIVPHDDIMVLRMNHQNDGSTYVDDVQWLLPSANVEVIDEKVITLNSDSVVYDGNGHGLKAVTIPAGLTVEYTYRDSAGNTLTGEPVDAGIYTVTAAVTDEGYGGASATATLEIRKAPIVITGTATATPVEFGYPLGSSVLDTTSLVATPFGGTAVLTGTYAWDNPDVFYASSGVQTFTFTPDDPNYKSQKLSVMVSNTGSDYLEKTYLDQNFNDTTVFKTNITNYYAAGNRSTSAGEWQTIYPQDGNIGTSVYDVTAIGGDGQAIKFQTLGLAVLFDNGPSSGEDFILSFRVYRAAGESMRIACSSSVNDFGLSFETDGGIKVRTTAWKVTGLTIPENVWTTVTVTTNRAANEYSISIQPDGESLTTSTQKGTLKAMDINTLKFNYYSSASPYIDDVRLIKQGEAADFDYKVAVTSDASAVIAETVKVQLNVMSLDKTTYNSFCYELSYDADKLTYVGATSGISVDSSTPGKLIVTGSGKDRSVIDILELTFTAKEKGSAEVTLDKAYVEETETDDIESTGTDSVTVNKATIAITGISVTLPEDFTGAAAAVEGRDYTFTAKNPNYDYTFDGSTMGGASVEVLDNGDGTFTVKNVSGDLVIVGRKTAKVFTVSVVGNAKDDAVAEETATYAEAYSFTVNMSEDYTYSVHVTINGEAYTPEKNGSTYTIAGADIVGDVVITVNKTVTPSTPVIEGVENGGVYYGQMTVTVTDPDGDLAKVYLDGSVTTLQNGKLVIIPNSKLFERSIKAVDAAGNETVVVFTVYEAAVETVVTMIGEIGEVTLRDTELIEAARAAYDALTEDQKAQVFNYDVLVAAEAALKALQDALPKISGNLSLNETIDINFIIPASVDMTDAVLVVKNAATGEDVEYTILPGIGGTTVVRYRARANHMTDEITVQVFDAEGNPLTQMASMSVRKYAGIRLPVAEDTEKMMLIRMLDYGALAQINSGVTTDLANSIVTDELRAFADAYDWADAAQLEVPAGSGGVFKAGLALNETIDVTVYTAATNVADGDKFVVKCNGEELSEEEYIVMLLDDGRYVIRYSVKSNEMSDEIYIAIVGEDNTVKAETTLGVRIYAQKFLAAVPTGNQAAMLLAMLDYGAMAQLYAGNTENLANCFVTDTLRQVLISYPWP